MKLFERSWVRIGLCGLALLFALRAVYSDWRLASTYHAGDLAIYMLAVERMNDGGSIYRWVNAGGMGFTYPPFAALLFKPLVWGPSQTVFLTWMSACLLIAVIIVVVLRLISRPHPSRLMLVASTALGVGLFLGSGQVQADLITGQVNLILALLVVLDVGEVVPARFRGVLTGIAAAIKLTPVIALGWFVLTRQWRAAANCLGAFVVAGLLAHLLLPADSVDFWTWAVHDVSRVGPVDLPMNASVTGTLAKAGVDGPVRTVLWLLVGGLLVLAAYWQAHRARTGGDPAAAAVLLGCAAIVATPIAWPHHQVWLPLAGLLLLWRGRPVPVVAGLVLTLFSFFHIPLSRLWDDAGMVELLLDDLDFLFFALVCVLGCGTPRSTSESRSEDMSVVDTSATASPAR
jgi:hypothetical protein